MAWTLYKRGRIFWAVQTVRGVRERRTTRCSDRRAAEHVVARWEREAADPRHHAAYSTSLEDAMNALLSDRETRGRAGATVKMYEQKAAHVLRVLGRETVLADIGAAEIDAYTEQRVAEGAHRNTVSKELTAIRSALKLARRRGQFDKAVADVMPIGWSSEYVPRKNFLTPDQTLDLMREVASDAIHRTKTAPKPHPDRAAHVAGIVAIGWRWSESLAARREDIDLDAGVVVVRGTKTEQSAATVVVPPAARGLLRFAVEHAANVGGRLFRPWHSVRRDLALACARAGIPTVTPNDLRRTCASWLVQRGVPVFAVSKVLRHADTRMVERVYGQLPPNDLRRLLEANAGEPITVSVAWQTPAHSEDVMDSTDDESLGIPDELVPRGGIEPSTRGFSIQSASTPSLDENEVNEPPSAHVVSTVCPAVAAEVADFRRRSAEWFARGAA